jgi:hypothetical protein
MKSSTNSRLHYFPNARIGTAYFLKSPDGVCAHVAVPASVRIARAVIDEHAIFLIAAYAVNQPAAGRFNEKSVRSPQSVPHARPRSKGNTHAHAFRERATRPQAETAKACQEFPAPFVSIGLECFLVSPLPTPVTKNTPGNINAAPIAWCQPNGSPSTPQATSAA